MAQAPSPLNQQVSRWVAHGYRQVYRQVMNSRPGQRSILPSLRPWLTRLQQSRQGLIAGSLALTLTLWHWQLVMSLGLGLTATTLTYLAHQNRLRHVNWQKLETQVEKLWSPANRSVSLAIAVGTLTLLTASTSIGLWQESHQAWLAIAVTLEGLGILALLGLVSWLLIKQPLMSKIDTSKTDTSKTEQQADLDQAQNQAQLMNAWLNDLANADPLKRLIAIGWLMDYVEQSKAEQSGVKQETPAYLADCFRLMLNRETEPLVCTALLDALRRFSSAAGEPRRMRLAASSANPVEMPTEKSPQVAELSFLGVLPD